VEANEGTRLGRRALLAAGAAGVAAVAAQAIAAPAKVLGADGQPVLIGGYNEATSPTMVRNTNGEGLVGLSPITDGVVGGTDSIHSGVYGFSTTDKGFGVYGLNKATGNIGALGTGNQGVFGSGGDTYDGVWGRSKASGKSGVYGDSRTEDGFGVYGKNLTSGTFGALGSGASGVWASAPEDASHFALQVDGRVAFRRSGLLTIARNKSSVSATVPALTATSMVLANLQANRAGVYVQAAVASAASKKITIYLNKKVTAATKVAYFILD
jgi:hypothetical protein